MYNVYLIEIHMPQQQYQQQTKKKEIFLLEIYILRAHFIKLA